MNTGNMVDTYTITATLGTLAPSSLTIPAGDTASTILTVSGTEVKTYTTAVTATSQNNLTKTKTTSVSTTVIPAVSIKATPASKTAYIGNDSTFTLTIKNIGTMSHTYNLSVTSTSDTADLGATSVSLAKSSSADITLTMNDSTPGMYTTKVIATDKTEPSKNASITVSTLYLTAPVFGVDLRVDKTKEVIRPGKYALYMLTVKNLGNEQETFDLNITLNETTASLTKDTVFLQPSGTVGDTATVQLNVTPATVGEYAVNVEAVSQNKSTASDSIKTTTKVAGRKGEHIVNSKVDETSVITNSTIKRSTIIQSVISSNSTVTDSEIIGCSIYNSSVTDTALEGITLEDASVNAGNITYGNITINGIIYVISEETIISELLIGADDADSSVAGTVDGTTTVPSENTGSEVTIGNKDSYVGGTVTAHKSTAPPLGISPFDLVGGYVNLEASDNIKGSLNWVFINVTYDPANIPEGMNEEDLRLRYYNTTTSKWENLNGTGDPAWCYGAGVNTVDKYVWANVSHFSIFAIAAVAAPIEEEEEAEVTPKPPSGGGAVAPPALVPVMNVPISPVTGTVTTTTTLTKERATLTIPVRTVVKDAEGNPLSTSITMLHTASTAKSIGAITAYDFGPSDTTFSEPIDLVIAYDPAEIPAGFREADLMVKMYDGTSWIGLDTSVDTVAHTATAKVSHFTIFALFAAAPVAPTPITPTPTVMPTVPPVTPTPTPPPPFPLVPMFVVILIVAAVIIVSVAYMVLRRKRE